MKPIILILSCKRDTENGRNAAMRLALSDSKIPYKFFQAESTRFDEIAVDASDNWESLAIKRQESLKWGLQHGYNEFFCVCVDVHPHGAAGGCRPHYFCSLHRERVNADHHR